MDILEQLPGRDSLAGAIEFGALQEAEVSLLSRLIPQVASQCLAVCSLGAQCWQTSNCHVATLPFQFANVCRCLLFRSHKA